MGHDQPQLERDFSVPEAQPFFFKGDGHGVLLVHGFTGSVSHMRVIGDLLRDQGFTVKGINLPGHASTVAEMKKTGAEDWYGAARDALKELRETCSFVTCCGLSMGGVITLCLAEAGLVDAAVSISAPMAVQNRLMPYAGLLAPFVPMQMWGEGDPQRPYILDQRYDLGYAGFPTRCAAQLSKLIRRARSNLAKITCPVLTVQSHGDETISPDSADVIQAGVSSKIKQALWLDGVPHVCTISPESGHIAQVMTAFLRKVENQP